MKNWDWGKEIWTNSSDNNLASMVKDVWANVEQNIAYCPICGRRAEGDNDTEAVENAMTCVKYHLEDWFRGVVGDHIVAAKRNK